MLLIKNAITWIKVNVIKVLLGLLLVSFVLISFLWNRNDYLKHDRNRIESNFEQVTQDNAVLNTTVDELKHIKTKLVAKYDSVIKAKDIKPKSVKSATIIESKYKDTTGEILSANTKPDTTKKVNNNQESISQYLEDDEVCIIPLSTDNGCWGMKAEVITKDCNTKLRIIEKTFNNSHQLIVVKKKKFLFWTVRPEQYRLFNDCGEGVFTQINFVKK